MRDYVYYIAQVQASNATDIDFSCFKITFTRMNLLCLEMLNGFMTAVSVTNSRNESQSGISHILNI